MGFVIWYTVFAAFGAEYAGVIVGAFYCTLLYVSEKGMIGDDSGLGVFLRAAILAVLVTFSGIGVDVAASKSDIIHSIERESGGENRTHQIALSEINERYKSEREEILVEQLALAKGGLANEKIDSIIEKMMRENEHQKQATIENLRITNSVKEADLGFLSILSTYLDSGATFKVDYYLYLFLIEILPLIVFCFFKLRRAVI